MASLRQTLASRIWTRSFLRSIGLLLFVSAAAFFVSVLTPGFHQNIVKYSQSYLDTKIDQYYLDGSFLASEEKQTKIPLNAIGPDDPRLIEVIRKNYLNPPSKEHYNLTGKTVNPSLWQADYVKKLLKEKRNGFFIECGAHNGEFLSNTLNFEVLYGWQGLLIEAFRTNYEQLITKNRKAWIVPACISINNYASMAMIKKVYHYSGGKKAYSYWKITNDTIENEQDNIAYQVPCFPLYSILLALNRTKIDYFSLDIEGNELNVLRKIPWDKVEITVVSAEFNHVDQGKNALREYMENLGYKVHVDGATLYTKQNIDFIFYHPKLLEETLKSSAGP